MEIWPCLIFFLLFNHFCVIKSEYSIIIKEIVKGSNEIQGVFNTPRGTYTALKQDKIYKIDLETGDPNPIKQNLIYSQYLSLRIVGTEKETIIGFGEKLLYFSDTSLDQIGIPVPYPEEKIEGSTILEINPQTKNKDDFYEILLGYGFYETNQSKARIVLELYDADIKNHAFTKKKSFDLPQTYSLINKNYISCKYFENGSTIACVYLDGNDSIQMGIINTDFTQLEQIQEIAPFVQEVKLIKVTENVASVVYFNFGKNIMFTRGYRIVNNTFSTADFTFKNNPVSINKNFDSNKFAATSFQGSSVMFIEGSSSSFKYYTTTYFDIQNSPIDSTLSKYDLTSKIKPTISNPSSFSMTNLGDNPEDGVLIVVTQTAYNGNAIYSVLIRNFPSCGELWSYTVSNKIEKFYINQLTFSPDTDSITLTGLSLLGDKSTDNGNLLNGSDKYFEYSSGDSGKGVIEYYIKEKKEQIISSPTCRKYIQVCNTACSKCIEFVAHSSKTTCISCADGYFPLVDDASQCSYPTSTLNDYYYDTEAQEFLRCHQSCLTCEGKGTNENPRCLSCRDEYRYNEEKKKCQKPSCDTSKSPWHYDSDGWDFVCVSSCPSSYPYFIKATNECVSECPKDIYNLKYETNCVEHCPKGASEINSECIYETMSSIIQNIDSIILELAKNRPTGSIDNSTYEIIRIPEEEENKNSFVLNISTVDLGECETKLKEVYNIPSSEKLLMFKVDIPRKGQISNQVEYSVFRESGEKLNLSHCKGITIKISSPLNPEETSKIGVEQAKNALAQGYDIYDPDDIFYNDVCTPFTSEAGTDVIIKDRKKYYYQNISFCESNCEYESVDFDTNRVNCSCTIKEEISKEEATFSFKALGESFTKMFPNSNLRIIKCYKLVFNGPILLKNILSWVLLSITFLELILISIYIGIDIKPLKKIVQNFIEIHEKASQEDAQSRVTSNDTKKTGIETSVTPGAPPKKFHKNNDNQNTNQNNTQSSQDHEIIIETEKGPYSNKKILGSSSNLIPHVPKNLQKADENHPIKRKKSPIKKNKKKHDGLVLNDPQKKVLHRKKLKKTNMYDSIKSKDNLIIYTHFDTKKVNPNEENEKKEEPKSTEKLSENLNFTDEELNGMKFEDAVKYDRRSFCKYYYSILKYDQSILFSFFTNTDFNLKVLKIASFIFSFCLYLSYNALFFSDSSMTRNYESGGKYDFVYGLPSSFFAFLCCYFTLLLLSCLSLSQPKIQQIKEEKDVKEAKTLNEKFVKCFKIKVVVFFCILMFFLGLFWYYDSAFGAIYVNTQSHLLLKTLVSFLMCNFYPFALCTLTSFVRHIALRKRWKCLFCFYYWFMNWFSNIIQMF